MKNIRRKDKMKKMVVVGLIAALGVGALSGCANSSEDVTSSDASVGSTAETDSASEATSDVIETDIGSVILADYAVTADKYIYTVTDEEVDEEVEYLVDEYAEYNEVDRAAQEGDYVWVALTATSDGEELEVFTKSDEYEIPLDGEYYGEEFDEHLIGSSVGDKLEFSVTYAEDDENADYPGMTVDYTVKVLGVSEEIVPELTEAFIQDELGYESEEDMREQIKSELEETNESDSEYEYREAIMEQYIKNCEFVDYDEDVYQLYYADAVAGYEEYVDMFEGVESVEEIYEFFGMTEDDVKQEALDNMYRTIVVDAISQVENIELTDEIFDERAARYAEEYEYDSVEDLLSDYDEDSLRYWIQDDLVLDFLESYATANEVEYEDEYEE